MERIPRPVAAAEDERFAVFEVTDDSYLPCFMPGAVLVATLGRQYPDVFHFLDLGEGVFVARLLPVEGGYNVVSCTRDLKSGFFKADALQIVGTVREFYPKGLSGPRMVSWQAVQTELTRFELPVLTAAAR